MGDSTSSYDSFEEEGEREEEEAEVENEMLFLSLNQTEGVKVPYAHSEVQYFHWRALHAIKRLPDKALVHMVHATEVGGAHAPAPSLLAQFVADRDGGIARSEGLHRGDLVQFESIKGDEDEIYAYDGTHLLPLVWINDRQQVIPPLFTHEEFGTAYWSELIPNGNVHWISKKGVKELAERCSFGLVYGVDDKKIEYTTASLSFTPRRLLSSEKKRRRSHIFKIVHAETGLNVNLGKDLQEWSNPSSDAHVYLVYDPEADVFEINAVSKA